MYLLTLLIIFSTLSSNVSTEVEHSNDTDAAPLNSIGSETTNFTQIYDQYLTTIQNRCLSEREFEELYGNKSKFGLVILFAAILMDEANKQIGLNELRYHFYLKPQQISFTDLINEQELEDNKKIDPQILGHFQKLIMRYSKSQFSNTRFFNQDVNVAEKFIDRKFPEIRQLFRVKYKEKYANRELPSNQVVDKALLDFSKMRSKIYKAIEHSTRESIYAF